MTVEENITDELPEELSREAQFTNDNLGEYLSGQKQESRETKALPEEVFEDISEDRFIPPQGAADAARQALEWIDEHGRDEAAGATEEGLARARQIIEHVESGDPLVETNDEGTPFVVEIAGFLNRHRENRDIAEEFEGEPWKDNGYLSWLLWGGDAADTWANGLRDRLDEEGYL